MKNSPSPPLKVVLKASKVVKHSIPLHNHGIRWKHKYLNAFRVMTNHLCEPDSRIEIDYLHPLSNSPVKEMVCLLEADELNSGAAKLRDFTEGLRTGNLTA